MSLAMILLFFAFWCLGLFLILLQSALLPSLLPPLWVPDLIYIFVAFCAYRFPWILGSVLVLVIAWIQDVMAAVELGFYPLECLAIFAIIKVLSHNTPVKKVVYQLPLVGIAYLLWQVVVHSFYNFFHFSHTSNLVLHELLVEVFLVCLLTLPCFHIFSRFAAWVEGKKMWMQSPRRRPRKRS